jgi:hypothetical protein
MRRWLWLLALVAVVQCGDDNGDATTPVSAFIGSITGGGATATVVDGTPPAAAGFPGVQIFGPSAVTKGATVQYEVAASGTTFTRVYIQISGMSRYYQLTLPAAVTTVQLDIAVASQIGVSNFEFVFGLYNAAVGQNYGSKTVTVS